MEEDIKREVKAINTALDNLVLLLVDMKILSREQASSLYK